MGEWSLLSTDRDHEQLGLSLDEELGIIGELHLGPQGPCSTLPGLIEGEGKGVWQERKSLRLPPGP